jgi:serine acetyltransferase
MSALLLRALWSELIESGLSCCGAALGAGSAVVGGGVVCANAAVAATSAVKANVARLTGYLLVMGHAGQAITLKTQAITLKTRDSRPLEASSREW